MSFFPQNLKYLRKTAHFSQEQLAEQLGLNRGNIASYEKGTAHPTIKKLLIISKFFGISVSNLYEKRVENTPLYKGKNGLLKSVKKLAESEESLINVEMIEADDLKKNATDFREAFDDFRGIIKNRHSSMQLVSKEMERMVKDYKQMADLFENILHSNAVLIDQLGKLEEENKALKKGLVDE